MGWISINGKKRPMTLAALDRAEERMNASFARIDESFRRMEEDFRRIEEP